MIYQQMFDDWIYKICELLSQKSHNDITDIYSSLNLSEAKLSFLDRVSPEEFVSTLNW